MGGGVFGNTEGVANQSGSELNDEQEDKVWDAKELEGNFGVPRVLAEGGKSSSNVTHWRVGFPIAGGGG